MAKPGIKGLNIVLQNLNKEITKIRRHTRAGMQKSVLLVKRESLKVTPHEYGNLRASAFTEVKKGASKIFIGIIGYRAKYAIWVHEAPGTLKGMPRPSGLGRYWDPKGIPGFLRKPLMANQKKVLKILRDSVEIK